MTADRTVPLPDVVVTLSQGAAERAGIVVSPVVAGQGTDGLRVPGVVMPNAYQQVVVTPLVSGRVTRVMAELGQAVRRGQTIAQVFSPELAEAQTRYVATRAELAAHDQELTRTEKLVGIGAASRQELERIHAEHVTRRADVETAAARLQLLGLAAPAIDALAPASSREATVDVPAPIAGVVTERTANVGLNVESTTPLVTVTDLSTVWVVVEIYEKDFSRVRVGSPASITTRAYPERLLQGRVSYIDPQVSPETRTAKARIEVPNTSHDLRLGMYAEAVLAAGALDATPMVPRTAVQNVGDRTVVYLVDPGTPGAFIEREVRLGTAAGDRIRVIAGVQIADVIASEGSFSLRAERERLGLRASAGQSPVMAGGQAAMQGAGEVQEANVTVSDTSFDPSRLTLRAGVPARLTFTRTSETTCATSVVFTSLKIKKELPLNVPVTIEFTPEKTGEIAFVCGMNMLRGTIIVR
ncbi:MAG: efflux RND transporter periplasmic adaptor subunit [Acidobacteria bacterium]|nr:efflux RND transporter periplasmic adaptor subunit [Acidobacteriota bacterium]